MFGRISGGSGGGGITGSWNDAAKAVALEALSDERTRCIEEEMSPFPPMDKLFTLRFCQQEVN